jgi:hypothetical protein
MYTNPSGTGALQDPLSGRHKIKKYEKSYSQWPWIIINIGH